MANNQLIPSFAELPGYPCEDTPRELRVVQLPQAELGRLSTVFTLHLEVEFPTNRDRATSASRASITRQTALKRCATPEADGMRGR
jgi:hypothetical protein